MMLDITAQKEAEEALRQSEERFKLLAWATKDAVWDWDLQTNQIWWGEGLQKIFHYPGKREQTNPRGMASCAHSPGRSGQGARRAHAGGERRAILRAVTELERLSAAAPGLLGAMQPYLGQALVVGFTGTARGRQVDAGQRLHAARARQGKASASLPSIPRARSPAAPSWAIASA